jgi:NAD(P)-dependent dehydrogenase (short-subunit alcohol dehydrogenase family)
VDRDVRRDRRARAVNALITGGAGGLGTSIAARFLRDGGSIALVDLSERVEAAAVDLRSAHPDARVVALRGDVADEAFAERAVAEAGRALGGLDVLVNNAGIGGPTTNVADTDPALIRRVLDVNLVGPFLMARAWAAAAIRETRGTAIVNIGSILGQQGDPGGAAYSASKGGIALLTQSLALELAPHGIRVNTVAPGNMATEMHWEWLRLRAGDRGTTFEAEVERVRDSIPLGRHGTGDDVAGAVARLVSDDASYVTGQTIGVNGGVFLT